MKKTFYIVIGVVVAIICGTAAYLTLTPQTNTANTGTLTDAINSYLELTDCANASLGADADRTLETERDKIISAGEEGKIEQAAKKYIYDVYQPYCSAEELMKEPIYSSGLTTEIVLKDMPNFNSTSSTLTSMISHLDKMQNTIDHLFDHDNALAYLDEETAKNSSNIETLDNLIKNIYSNTKLKEDYINYTTKVRKTTSGLLSIVGFLVNNQSNWQIKDDRITFNTTTLTNRYNELIENI